MLRGLIYNAWQIELAGIFMLENVRKLHFEDCLHFLSMKILAQVLTQVRPLYESNQLADSQIHNNIPTADLSRKFSNYVNPRHILLMLTIISHFQSTFARICFTKIVSIRLQFNRLYTLI